MIVLFTVSLWKLLLTSVLQLVYLGCSSPQKASSLSIFQTFKGLKAENPLTSFYHREKNPPLKNKMSARSKQEEEEEKKILQYLHKFLEKFRHFSSSTTIITENSLNRFFTSFISINCTKGTNSKQKERK